MTKQELYKALCIEAGTFGGGSMTDNEWYEACDHNITLGMDEDFQRAAEGDLDAIITARSSVGLPPFA